MKLILFGAPGVGKGTQGTRVAKKYNIPQISTGDILRAALNDGTRLGLMAKAYTDKGELVPDDIIISMIRERLQKDDCKQGFILDGFPRSLPQARALDKLLIELNSPLDRVVNLDVPEDEIVNRLKNRRICKKCGKDYNIITNPPPADMKCRVCGGEIYQRDDDTEKTIRNRLTVYKKVTEPLISYYNKKKIFKTVNGINNPDEVYNSIIALLKGVQ